MVGNYDTSLFPAKKTFLFDIGRVLLDFDFESSLAQLLPDCLSDANDRIRQVLAQKNDLEKGILDPEQYANWALTILQSDAGIDRFYQAWRNIFTYNKPMWDCVKTIAAQHHDLILISNINAIHCPWIFETYPEFSLFQYRALSFQIGSLKPDPAIYRYAIDIFALNPNNTIYIDDLAENIAIGNALGFRCWQYDLNRHKAFETWLQDILCAD